MKTKKPNRARLIVGLIVVAVLIIAATMNRQTTRFRSSPDALYADATPAGGKGLALLLQKLGYKTAVQNAPLQQMPKDARVWLLFGPDVQFSGREGRQLLNWVKRGNVLIYCANRGGIFSFHGETKGAKTGVEIVQQALQIGDAPPDFGVTTGAGDLPELPVLPLDVPSNYRAGVKGAQASGANVTIKRPHLALSGAPGGTLARVPYGKGAVWVTGDAWLFTNFGLSKPNNATLVANLIRLDAPKGTVYFDERRHGNDERPPAPDTLMARLRKPPVSYAIAQLLGAALLFWAFAARRLGAAVPLPARGPVTRASQFAQAMGAVFSKTNRPSAAASIIGDNFRRRLAQRLGMSPNESDQVLARRAHEVAGVPFELVDRLLLQTRTPARSDAQALRDAQEMDAVLKQLEGRV